MVEKVYWTNLKIFQIENLLISDKGVIKLCDFGSATTDALYPDDTWSALQRSMAEDEVIIVTFENKTCMNLSDHVGFAYIWQ